MFIKLNAKVMSKEAANPFHLCGIFVIAHIASQDIWVSGFFNEKSKFVSDISIEFLASEIDFFFEVPDRNEIVNY